MIFFSRLLRRQKEFWNI